MNLEKSLEIASPKVRVARLGVSLDNKPVGVAQGTYTSYLGVGMTFQVICGPVASMQTDNLELFSFLINGLEDICRTKRIVRLEIWALDSWKAHDLLLKMGYSSIDRINDYVINLDPDMQKFSNSIDHNKRRNIKTAEREGVQVVQSQSKEDIETFCLLHQAAAERDGFSPVPKKWFETASKTYSPETWQVVLAKWGGKSIAGLFVVTHRNTAYALRAGSLTECLKVRPNDMMHWKTMEWASAKGFTKYNMGMVDAPIPTEGSSKWGIWRWKKEWHGYLERIEIFEKIILPKYKRVLQARDTVYETIKHLH